MISIRNLTFGYGDHAVLDCPDMSFEEGLVHGIVGLNGAGKSTFFNLLAKYLKPHTGNIQRNGQPLQIEEIGFLETNNYFYSNITGNEYLRIFPLTNTQFKLELMNTLFQLPLRDLVSSYSTGMKKKLALLALLQQDVPVYILDEPFNGLDMESNKVVEMIIGSLKGKGKTVFISSHMLSPLVHGCDLIHILQKGNFNKTYSRDQFGSIEQELFEYFNQKAAATIKSAL